MQDEFVQFVGRVLTYGGGGAVVAFGIFRWLGSAWIENKFAARLKQLEHDQAMVVARLKVEVDSQLSGALKFQERDFTVLPAIWDKLDVAFVNVQWLTSPMQEQARVSELNDLELAEYLADDKMMEFQKEQIRSAKGQERQRTYAKIKFLYQLSKVRGEVGEFQRYLAANAIFFTPTLKAKLSEIEAILWGAISLKQTGQEVGDFKMQTQAWEKLEKEGKPIREAIEKEIRGRLQSHLKVTTTASIESR